MMGFELLSRAGGVRGASKRLEKILSCLVLESSEEQLSSQHKNSTKTIPRLT